MVNKEAQYAQVYGEFAAGRYFIGDELPGHGTVVWSYRNQGGQLVYVVDDNSGWPAEVQESEVQQ